ncbi:MmgE/PrpD family protein [Ancylobacter mangrovi]|uniref:MmgE/PrpD family protein n=1 Tax=Ancylobacter mangrovi TaxID=2972472 RepID=UPI002161963D|nr:MmgE/PrpD family protein [Ancylobacter mangrovi]MCS0503180.1 MmgE/PrpD family protein [Ancylobacter mangrovi]
MNAQDIATTQGGPSLTRQFANYWSSVSYEELPPEVVAMCKRLLLDTLLVGARGADSDDARATTAGAADAFGPLAGPSALWDGSGRTAAPAVAALINGTATHALEFDDFGGCGHSSAVVVPAVCAIAEAEGIDGRGMIRALAAGYDLAHRMTAGVGGYRPHNDRGWHSTGTCGTFGAAAGAAAALGLDAERFTWALGIASSNAAGTWSYLGDGAMTKRFHPGRATSNGVVSAYLARSGLTGPAQALEARWGGFFSTYCGPEAVPEAVIDKLGVAFGVMTAGIKLFPCCRGLHSSIEALLDIMSETPCTGEEIDTIIVHGAERTRRQFSKREMTTILDGQFSLPYALASIATSGDATLEEFIPLRTGDPRVAALMERVEVRADRPLGPYDEPDVEVILKDGRQLAKHVPVSKGAAARPPSDAELARKHAAIAAPVFEPEAFEALGAMIAGLEDLKDFRDCTRLLTSGRRR